MAGSSAIDQAVSRRLPTAAARVECDGQKWRWGRFSPRTSVSPANLYIPSTSPQSSSLSPEAGTIGQEWPQCQ
jgi:hypothetical protein